MSQPTTSGALLNILSGTTVTVGQLFDAAKYAYDTVVDYPVVFQDVEGMGSDSHAFRLERVTGVRHLDDSGHFVEFTGEHNAGWTVKGTLNDKDHVGTLDLVM